MIPHVWFLMDLPEPLASDRSVVAMHTRAAKEALGIELVRHHERRMPGHFSRGAHSKYRHANRKLGWILTKRNAWGSDTDIVASGREADDA
jgi:hypothetical protein